ncbi:MAG: FAD-binding protein [Gammaproteobacteria bacterium]|nr:FAD-binding protein [Gammaproteobacteria bacterium]
MSNLVIAEHNNEALGAATLNTVTAATQIGGDVHVLVAGSGAQAVAEAAASVTGVSKVLVADGEQYKDGVSVELANLIVSLAGDYSHIMAASSTSGKDVMPRVAALLDVAQISDIIAVDAPDTFKRPIYAGNAIATVQSSDETKVLTVRPTGFDAAAAQGGSAEVVSIDAVDADGSTAVVGRELTVSERPDLGSADIVVSGGRGVGSAENFKIIEALADKLGAAVGASRAAVDAGYMPNDYQVGQTGKVVAPSLYIAVGISGAIQHLAGMKDSKVIVAINKDEEAPIFQVSDYGLVADLFEAVPELVEAL